MNKKTIIHIGLHKTASTFLQEVVFPKLQSYTYLMRPFTQHNFAFNQLQYADDSLFDSKLVLNELEKIKTERLLISDESLSGKPVSFGYINRSLIANRLQKVLPDAEIILFLRGQESILLSHYNQWVKGYPYGTRTIDEFIWHPTQDYSIEDYLEKKPGNLSNLFWNTNQFYLNTNCFRYLELVDLYNQLFKKVHVFLFEDFQTQPGQTLHQLEEILEEPLNRSEILTETRVNQSIPLKDVNKQIRNNKIGHSIDNKYLRKALQLMPSFSRKKKLDSEQYIQQLCSGFYQTNNQQLIKQYPEIGLQNFPDSYQQ